LRAAVVKHHLGPQRAGVGDLGRGASEGITITAGTPNSRAARATPWAWLPGIGDDAPRGPVRIQRRQRRVTAANLKLPVCCRHSGLDQHAAAGDLVEERGLTAAACAGLARQPSGGGIMSMFIGCFSVQMTRGGR
jgi:hypothetical protein